MTYITEWYSAAICEPFEEMNIHVAHAPMTTIVLPDSWCPTAHVPKDHPSPFRQLMFHSTCHQSPP